MKMADAKQKRNEQLKRWIGSETDLEPPVVKRKKTKVKFDDGAVFLAACSSGDTEEVLRLLERGADINYANVDGLTALHQVGAGPIEGPLAGLGRGEGGEAGREPPPGGGGRGRRWLRSLRWGVSGRGGGGRVSLGSAAGRRGCRGGRLRPLPAGRASEGADGPLLRREGGAAGPLSFSPLGSASLGGPWGVGPAPYWLRGPEAGAPRHGRVTAGERSGLASGGASAPAPCPGSR